jgi:hypothetical protein
LLGVLGATYGAGEEAHTDGSGEAAASLAKYDSQVWFILQLTPSQIYG